MISRDDIGLRGAQVSPVDILVYSAGNEEPTPGNISDLPPVYISEHRSLAILGKVWSIV